jgi:hypothetical protein
MVPMEVVRSGKFHNSASMPCDLKWSNSIWHCVLLPALSAPSSTIKAPREGGVSVETIAALASDLSCG